MKIFKLLSITLGLIFCLIANTAIASTGILLPITSENLNEKPITLPDGLPADRTLLIVAFQREQQANVDTWVDGMSLHDSSIPWLELPVIDNPGLLARWFINNGMRRGIPETAVRAHVVSIYTDKAKFVSALGITDESTVYALVADRDGHVLETVKGDYNQDGAQTLMKAFGSSP